MYRETEMGVLFHLILRGAWFVQTCSGDTRGKKGLETVTESLKDLTLKHCAWHQASTVLLQNHLHSVCPVAKVVPTGYHRQCFSAEPEPEATSRH